MTDTQTARSCPRTHLRTQEAYPAPVRMKPSSSGILGAMSKISERFQDLSAKFTKRVDAVPDDKWDSPSPCEDWTTREVVGHMVGNCSMFLGLIDRKAPPGPSVEDDPRGAWANGRDAIQAVLDDPKAATTEYDGVMGKTTFEKGVAQFGFIDLVIHSWDVARAAGGDEKLDPADVHATFEMVEPMDEMLRHPGVAGAKVAVPPDADEQTRLLAFMGRTP
jgi:uncharacterized protein (TIGR03086 family)